MKPIASLMMYDMPPVSAATTRYWSAIRSALADHGIAAPEALANEAPEFEVWESPALVLSQTCGMPYRLYLHGKVQLVGTPDFALDGCPPGHYRSAFVVRADDDRATLDAFRTARFAYNQTISQSGWAGPWAHLQPRGWWFTKQLQTGGHAASARAVAEGKADIASLDGQTWRLLQRHDSVARRLRVIDWTAPTPGLPYITARGADAAGIAEAVSEAIASLSGADRAALDIQGLVQIPAEAYLAVQSPPQTAAT